MKTKLKFWYYRNIKYGTTKFKIELSCTLGLGTKIISSDMALSIHIGKGWFIPYNLYV